MLGSSEWVIVHLSMLRYHVGLSDRPTGLWRMARWPFFFQEKTKYIARHELHVGIDSQQYNYDVVDPAAYRYFSAPVLGTWRSVDSTSIKRPGGVCLFSTDGTAGSSTTRSRVQQRRDWLHGTIAVEADWLQGRAALTPYSPRPHTLNHRRMHCSNVGETNRQLLDCLRGRLDRLNTARKSCQQGRICHLPGNWRLEKDRGRHRWFVTLLITSEERS